MAKSLVKFYKINSSKFNSLPIKEGQIIYLMDKHKLYIDTDSSTRTQVDGVDFSYGLSLNNKVLTISKNGGDSSITLPDDLNTTYTFEQDVTDRHKIIITPSNGEAITLTIPDNDTTYSAGAAIGIDGTTIKNNGVRGISRGDNNGTIKVNTGGTIDNVEVTGLQSLAYKSSLTASEVGAIAITAKGANGGVAELDANGKVPSSQLPSYVDDVLEFNNKSSFPSTGESGKIYVAKDNNLTYRWSGSEYVEISASLALGETSSTAYRGDKGKTAYSHATDSNRLTTAKASGLYKVASTAEGHIASLTAITKDDITGLGIPGSDTNTTYTLSADTTNNKVTLTPSSGTAQSITVPYATSAGSATSAITAEKATKDANGNTISTTYYKASNPSGFTSNTGTITKVQANGTDVASSGVANIPSASTSRYGVTQLSNATNSTSEVLAATPKAVKAAYDLAGQKLGASDVVVTQTLTSGAEVGSIKIGSNNAIKLYAPEPGAVATELANPRQTYYLTGVTDTHASTGSQMYNTRVSNQFTGVKYETSTSEKGGTLTVDDREVTLDLYYAIS